MRTLLAIGVTGAALAAAAAFGTGSSGAVATDTASLAPRGAGAFVVVDTDRSSAQWKNAETLLAKIPGGKKALDSLLSQLGGAKGLDVEKDVAPALGKQVVIVVPGGAKNPILLVKPDDAKKLGVLLAKSKKHEVSGSVEGWTAVAMTAKELGAYKNALAKGTLSGDTGFAKAMVGVPSDALVRAYLDGAGLPAALGSLASAGASVTGGVTVPAAGSAIGQLGTIGFALTFEPSDVRLDGSIATKRPAASFTPKLLGGVPSDALVALSFSGAGGGQSAVDQALKQGGAQVAALEKQFGIKVADLTAALDGEGVLYVRPGAPTPEITLAVHPTDAARARRAFSALVKKLSAGQGSTAPVQGLRLTTASVGGIVFVSTAKGAAAGFTGHGPKLTGTNAFKQAAQQVGFNDKTSGFGFVDVHALGPLLKAALGSLGGSGSVTGLEGLSAFGTAAFNTAPAGARSRFAAIVTVG